ncbi:hypothetical protein HDV00_009010 [Rhizophlyctis rosea]|nr:hypothetical protein HDV00_009010 [Rhizophlyctis rosea]
MKQTTRLILLGTFTGAFMVAELVLGYVSKSLALIADSFHMMSDVLSVIVGWYAIKLAGRTNFKSNRYSYGWQRAEVLGALVNCVFLLALCFTIAIEALQRFVEPSDIENPWLVLYIGIGLAVNLAGLLLFHGGILIKISALRTENKSLIVPAPVFVDHSHGSVSSSDSTSGTVVQNPDVVNVPVTSTAIRADIIQIAAIQRTSQDRIDAAFPTTADTATGNRQSLNMRGVFLNVAGDALGSVGVIISAIVLILLPGRPKWSLYVDPIISIFITGIILFSTIPLVKSASYILLQSVPIAVPLDRLREEIAQVPGVDDVHELHVWQLSETKTIATVHIRLRQHGATAAGGQSQSVAVDYMEVTADIKRLLHRYGIHSSTVQPEKFSGESQACGILGSSDSVVVADENLVRSLLICNHFPPKAHSN